jgi:hypothetical protein
MFTDTTTDGVRVLDYTYKNYVELPKSQLQPFVQMGVVFNQKLDEAIATLPFPTDGITPLDARSMRERLGDNKEVYTTWCDPTAPGGVQGFAFGLRDGKLWVLPHAEKVPLEQHEREGLPVKADEKWLDMLSVKDEVAQMAKEWGEKGAPQQLTPHQIELMQRSLHNSQDANNPMIFDEKGNVVGDLILRRNPQVHWGRDEEKKQNTVAIPDGWTYVSVSNYSSRDAEDYQKIWGVRRVDFVISVAKGEGEDKPVGWDDPSRITGYDASGKKIEKMETQLEPKKSAASNQSPQPESFLASEAVSRGAGEDASYPRPRRQNMR